jgi:PhnB protein
MPAKPVPEGAHTVTTFLTVRNSAAAIEFYKAAFGAVEISRSLMPGSSATMHAEIKIGDTTIALSDEMPGMGVQSPETLGATTASLYLYVEHVDAAFQRAMAAGAKSLMPPTDMFWGDRYSAVADPSGHQWGIASHQEDLAPEEITKRAEAFFAQMPKG